MQYGTTTPPHGWLKPFVNWGGCCQTIGAGVGKEHVVIIEMEQVKIRQATKQGWIPCEIGGVADLSYPDSENRRGRVIERGMICPTLTTENVPNVLEKWTWEIDGEKYLIRIRKLTPKECWRLMFADGNGTMESADRDFGLAAEVNSNTQLYAQAGNSICKQVLCDIFKNLLGN